MPLGSDTQGVCPKCGREFHLWEAGGTMLNDSDWKVLARHDAAEREKGNA